MTDTAVIPAAGHGLRMRPLTMSIPKEMLPLREMPVIEHTVIELVSSGIKRICIVIRKGKEIIENYFHERKDLYRDIELYFPYQESPLGLGDALRCAKGFIGKMPFVMAIPDQILLSEVPATRQLLNASKMETAIWNSMVRLTPEDLCFFRGSRPFSFKKTRRYYILEGVVTDDASLLRGFGRTVFQPEALEFMTEKYISSETGETDLMKTFQELKKLFRLCAIILKGKACDVGSWEGYYHYQPVILNHLRGGKTL